MRKPLAAHHFLAIAFLVTSCADARREEMPPRVLTLIGENDSLPALELVSKQSAFIRMLAEGDQQGLSSLLDVTFVWRQVDWFVNVGSGPEYRRAEAEPLGYFAILNGTGVQGVRDLPATHRVSRLAADRAMVTSRPGRDGRMLYVGWRRTPEGWRALNALLLSREPAAGSGRTLARG